MSNKPWYGESNPINTNTFLVLGRRDLTGSIGKRFATSLNLVHDSLFASAAEYVNTEQFGLNEISIFFK